MNALAILMIVGCGGLALSAGLAGLARPCGSRLGVLVAIAGSLALAVAGFVARVRRAAGVAAVHWFAPRPGRRPDRSARRPVPDPDRTRLGAAVPRRPTEGPRAARALRPVLVLCVVGVIVVDNVFEFLIVYELTVVAIYALISVRYEDRAPIAPPP